jgi:ComF family protein
MAAMCRASGVALQCALDFLVEDCCVLCGKPGNEAGSATEDPRLAALARSIRVRYLGCLDLENRPVCAHCLGRFEASIGPGTVARLVAPTTLETARGERFTPTVACGAYHKAGAPTGPGAIAVYSAFMTNDAVLGLVHRFKFSRYKELGLLLGGAMAAAFRLHGDGEPRLLVTMPMADGDQRRRGFNPVDLLARPIATRLAFPVATGALGKVRRTPRQSLTPHEARADNVRGVFRAEPGKVAGRRVLLLDDLVTTGATAAAATVELIASGAVSAEVLCFARAL